MKKKGEDKMTERIKEGNKESSRQARIIILYYSSSDPVLC